MGLKSGISSAGLGRIGSATKPEVSLEQLLQHSQAVQLRAGNEFVKSLAMDEDQLALMPKAAQPLSLRSQLLPYQLQGLAWMMSKEKPQFPLRGSSDSVQLWKRNARGDYVNVASNFTVKQPPGLVSGGILADDMGLGKTLQVISVILADSSGSTLIVAPVSVMSNWEQQVQRHVLAEHAPRVLIYHGSSRQANLTEYDIVVTSYGTLSSEVNRGPLYSTNWRRVVLDEGHTIRNSKTKVAEAASALKAQSRWVLTGTPMWVYLHIASSWVRLTWNPFLASIPFATSIRC